MAAGARVSLVCGVGFDPRMCLGLEMLTALAEPARLTVHAIEFEAPADPSAAESAQETTAAFQAIAAELDVRELATPQGSRIEQMARGAADLFEGLESFGEASDVVVDVNALPRALFFPLISKLLYLCDERPAEAPNLHVIAGDAAWLDALIEPEGLDEHAVWLHPYAGTFMSESDLHRPRVWMPVLGEGSAEALRRIADLVSPHETCPLLPFPSREPRRGDLLFDRYREVLFDRLRSDYGTVAHASEGNPFQVYRRLRQSTVHYSETLEPLGGSKIAYSALSSKLMALGVLLVAYELRTLSRYETGVADIGAQQRRLSEPVSLARAKEKTTLVGLTVSGDCYL